MQNKNKVFCFRIYLLIFYSCLLAASQALAEVSCDQLLEDLVNSKSRPTMTEVELYLYSCGESHAKLEPLLRSYRPSKHIQALISGHSFAHAIAVFEKTFPNATYYPLGRDAVLVGDILDAYFLSQSQSNRVHRLDASRPSFNDNVPETIRFLETNGLDSNALTRSKGAKILLDVTSYSRIAKSQSVQLMDAAYEMGRRAGISPDRLAEKVHFISLGGYYRPEASILDMSEKTFSYGKALALQKSTIDERGPQFPFIFGLHDFTYSAAWHEIFGPFKTTSEGVKAPRGRAATLDAKIEILLEMFTAYGLVSSKKFLEKIKTFKDSTISDPKVSDAKKEKTAKPIAIPIKMQPTLISSSQNHEVKTNPQTTSLSSYIMHQSPPSDHGQDAIRRLLASRDNSPLATVNTFSQIVEDSKSDPLFFTLLDFDYLMRIYLGSYLGTTKFFKEKSASLFIELLLSKYEKKQIKRLGLSLLIPHISLGPDSRPKFSKNREDLLKNIRSLIEKNESGEYFCGDFFTQD